MADQVVIRESAIDVEDMRLRLVRDEILQHVEAQQECSGIARATPETGQAQRDLPTAYVAAEASYNFV